MLEQTKVVREARETLRDALDGSPIYDETFAEIYNFLKWGVPDADLHHGAQVGLMVALYMAQAPECVEVCHHQITQTIGAILDRIMTIEEIRERVEG